MFQIFFLSVQVCFGSEIKCSIFYRFLRFLLFHIQIFCLLFQFVPLRLNVLCFSNVFLFHTWDHMFQLFFLLFPFVRNMRMTIPIFIASFCPTSVITCSKYNFSITKLSLNVYKFFLRFLFLSYLKLNVAIFLLLFLFKIWDWLF